MKVGPFPVIIYKGIPNLEKILVSRKKMTCSSCECLSGTTSVHLMKLSVAVKIKNCLAEDGGLIGMIKSRPHFEKGKSEREFCKSMVERRSFPTSFWHLSQYIENL
jgi:hypothetical protein